MLNWNAMAPGIATAAAGLALSFWWFGIRKRRQLEVAAGIQALAGMKWRECAGLVMEALSRQGYSEEMSSRQPGDGGTEFLLRRGGDSILLSYKHGTAYRLGDSNIREFANAIQLSGAVSGILITLGSIEGVARDLARQYDIKLMDGASVWPLVESLVPQSLRGSIRQQASAQNRVGLLIGIAASAVVGFTVMFLGIEQSGSGSNSSLAEIAPVESPTPVAASADTSSPATEVATTAVPASASPSPAPVGTSAGSESAQINAALRAMEEVAKLSDEQRAKRRADVAARIAKIGQIRSAAWSTQSTLLLSLSHSDGKDVALVTEVCDMLSRYEELRYMRLQLEPPQGTDYRVRWRMCQ